MENYIVYMHTTPNGKKYIGMTGMNPLRRWENGLGYKPYGVNSYRNVYFWNAIEKYGWENIKHEILFDNLTKEQAEQKEVELIAYYNSNNREFGYNIQNGGNSKGKMSELQIERQKQRIYSDETKKKISNSLKGKPSHNKGKPMSQETKNKISIARKGKPLSKEHKEAISKAQIGIPLSAEHKNKLSELAFKRGGKRILQLDKNTMIPLQEFNSIREAARNVGVSHKAIHLNLIGEHKSSGGYIWKYAD